MNREEYLRSVNENFYQGEVLGEAFFLYCVEHETDPERRYKWANLLQLETETKARLRPFLASLGLGLAQDDVAPQIAEITADFDAKTWQEKMLLIASVTDMYLERFREIEAAAPNEAERDMAHAMIVHETAINNFAKLELAGEAQDSITATIAQLKWPIPRP